MQPSYVKEHTQIFFRILRVDLLTVRNILNHLGDSCALADEIPVLVSYAPKRRISASHESFKGNRSAGLSQSRIKAIRSQPFFVVPSAYFVNLTLR